MGRVRDWMNARRPFWVVFPTRRLAIVVVALSMLWLVPGTLGFALAWSAAALTFVAVAIDFTGPPLA